MFGFLSKCPMNHDGLIGESVPRAAGVLIGRVSRAGLVSVFVYFAA